MGKFTKISQAAFEGLQTETGVLLTTFDPTNPVTPPDNTILCATTGGIQIDCKPTYSDFGEDVDNVPKNTKELAHLDSWECSISTTSLSFNPAFIKTGLGSADVVNNKVVPRRNVRQTDFSTLWWVGDIANGGAAAVKIFNALSTDGLSIKTGKNAKGQSTVKVTAFASLSAQDTIPMEFYSIDPTEYTVEFDSTGGTLVSTQTVVAGGKATQPTAPTRTGYTFAGWYTSTAYTTQWDFATDTVNTNMILYAKWTEVT